jgi:hypothetical protein
VKSKSDDELAMLADAGQVQFCPFFPLPIISWTFVIGLEFLQRAERPVLAHPKIQNQ